MSTQRFAMAVRLKDEKREYYIQNHANVWPEVLEELKKINVKNYSIYLKEDFMFGYLEYDGADFNRDMETMQKISRKITIFIFYSFSIWERPKYILIQFFI